jgi:hypothetical protein
VDETRTPAEVAQAEAARQAVILVFAALTLIALMPLQRRLVEQMTAGMRDPRDTSGAQEARMRAAAQAASRWDKAAAVLWQVGPWRAARWCHRRAEAAREAYQAERLA